MEFRKTALFLLYGAAVTGFCLHQHHTRLHRLEEIQPYAHGYQTESTETPELSETSKPETLQLPETEPPSAAPPAGTAPLSETETTAELSESLPETKAETVTKPPETKAETVTELPETTEIQFPLELNRATREELCALPEIGEIIAQNIIDYREANGGFLNRRQLLEISGIGEYKYSLILPYLYLETEYSLPEPEPEQETVPEIDPTEPPEETVFPEIPVINLNTASREELLLLPDCNEALAEEILTLRDREIHIFYNILEITLAEHVTPELFRKWETYLTVDDDGSTQIPYTRAPEYENQD